MIEKNDSILITGGSSGIGLATAKTFIEAGADVFITGRNAERLDTAKKELGDALTTIQADVSDTKDNEKVCEIIKEKKGYLTTIFANAGVAEGNVMGETSIEAFDNTFDINVKGMFFTVQSMLPLLKNGSSIVLNASIVANKGMANLSLYNASKAAVRSFSRSWANDLKSRHIRVNTISPGVTETPIFTHGLDMSKEDIENLKASLVQTSPIGRMGTPQEIADTVFFLASNKASYINGIELAVDGGFAQI